MNTMKKKIRFSIRLKDLSSFQFHEGAKEFMEKFKDYESSYSYYTFYLDDKRWEEAKKELNESKLSYSEFYEIELATFEIIDYPAFNIAIPPLYNLLKSDGTVNEKEMSSIPMAEDFNTGKKILEKSFFEILNRLCANFNNATPAKGKKREFFVINSLPEIKSPRVILQANNIKENTSDFAGTHYFEGWDGRSLIDEESINEIKKFHLCASYFFSFNGKIYKQNFPNHLVSGNFAYEIKKTFKDKVQLTPVTFDNI